MLVPSADELVAPRSCDSSWLTLGRECADRRDKITPAVCRSVASFFTGSSAPPARRVLPRFAPRGPALRAGASRPSSRTPPATRSGHEERVPRPSERPGHPQLQQCRRRVTARRSNDLRAADPTIEDLHAAVRRQGRCASRRDGLRPPLTPGTDEQVGWLSGRWLSHGRGRERREPRSTRHVPHVFPRPGIERNRGTLRSRGGGPPKRGEAFAMRRSGVRIPQLHQTATPSHQRTPAGGTGFRRCPSALLCSRASPAPRRSEAARSPDDPRCATTCSSWRSTRVRAKPELSPERPPLASHKLAAVCRRSWIRGPGARRTQWPNASPQTRAAGVRSSW